eukprot:390822-Prymnesium_polylepis.1
MPPTRKRSAPADDAPLVAVLLPDDSMPAAATAKATMPLGDDVRFVMGSTAAAFDDGVRAAIVGVVWVPPASLAELKALFPKLPQCRW